MFITAIKIKNLRAFKSDAAFELLDLNVPDSMNDASGLNVFVGENGCGKTTILDALALPILEYKAEGCELTDFNSKDLPVAVEIISDHEFTFDGFVPNSSFRGKGFKFEARLRSRDANGYLSSLVVTDQQFIRADGQVKPEDNKPELRLAVNNPWRGKRFAENDVLYLDKNRLFQVRSGTYNSTRFDRLMEDFGHKYLKSTPNPPDYDKALTSKVSNHENEYLKKAIDKFQALCGEEVRLSLVDNFEPFNNGFFSIKKDDNQLIKVGSLGSGYEMIFTLLYSFFLAQQSGKQLIILIDEPELHLHPRLQAAFADLLVEFSSDAQIFVTTHSPLLVKQLMTSSRTKIKILTKETGEIKEADLLVRKLAYLSANEVNYIAFGLATEEYHNELYEELYMNNNGTGIKAFDIAYFQQQKHEPANYPWLAQQNQVTLHTHVRNQIHHRGTLGAASLADIEGSINAMRGFL